MNAQTLLAKLVDMAGGPTERGYVLALADLALEDVPDTFRTPKARYQVFRPQTELGLRRLLWKMADAPLVAIVERELAVKLPPDIVRRSRGAAIHELELRDVLELALGVRVVPPDDPQLQELVVEHLSDLHVALGQRTLPTVVGRDLLEQLLLEVLVGNDVRESSPAKLLAGWLREPPSARWDEPVRRLLAKNLPTLQGPSGGVLAWALDDEARLRELVIRGLLLEVDAEELPPAIWGDVLRPLLKECSEYGLEPSALRRLLRDLAVAACGDLDDDARDLLTAAERVGREQLSPRLLATSTVLPLGLANRLEELAKRAADGQAVTAEDVRWLEEHRAARFHRDEIEVVEQMARLSRYLVEADAADPVDVVGHVLRYQRSGAFADLTAMRLRRRLASTGRHQRAATRLLDRWRARRDEENRLFAEALSNGYSSALFAEGLTPLPRLWKDQALLALAGGAAEGLYLVVLDGCAYPVFLELVSDLWKLPQHPLGFRPISGGLAQGIAALAPLPTITSHSRGSIFLGELPDDPLVPETVWRDQGEGTTDPARFARNPALGHRTRKLFLKGDLGDGSALYEALGDQSLDIVAAVFNAVDDLIGSSATGAAFEMHADQIHAFIPSLRRALDAGRRVLVTADHGFTPYLGSSLKAGDGLAPRYTTLSEGETPPDGFLEIDLGGLGGALTERTAFAWKIGTYLKRPQVGFHGGCGLEEMVVPLAWITAGDEALPPDLPPWWADVITTSEPTAPLPSASPPPMEQGDLFDEQPTLADMARLIVGAGLPQAVVDTLDDVKIIALAKVVENGSARVGDLAKATNKKASRTRQMMSALQQKLHTSGAPRLRSEELPDGEVQFVWVPPEGGQ